MKVLMVLCLIILLIITSSLEELQICYILIKWGGLRDIIQLILLQLTARFFSRGKRTSGQFSSNPLKVLLATFPRFRSEEYKRKGVLLRKEELMCQVRKEVNFPTE
jgi:hypothetical protein